MPNGQPEQLANLKHGSGTPGVSNNPVGRPVGSISLVTAAKKYLRDNPSKIDEIITAICEAASKGKLDAIKELKIWTDGLPTNKVQVTNIEPIVIHCDNETTTLTYREVDQLSSPE